MPEHNFELTISGALTDERLDALVDAGCDDATFSTKGDLTFADFTSEAPTMLDAIVSAIAAVESVEGLEVLHVDPDELVWASEIAERTGRTRQSVDQLIKGQRGPGDFPAPASHATRNPLWRWSEVETWFAGYEGRQPDTERSLVLGAINGALQARHSLRGANEAAPLRRALEQLLVS
ncbi:MAG: helix-turn-helix transcriptional regulator [Acidimicrobiia bacterium]